MRVLINDQQVNIPSSLSEITLKQRIDYQNEHGNYLDERLKEIQEMPDGLDKDLEVIEFQTEKMFRTFAFFTGTTVEALKESSFINYISAAYYSSLHTLFQDEDEMELRQEFLWNGEIWQLHPVELKQGSKMTFGELIDAKQMVKDFTDLGANRWEIMQKLCAIYLRKKDEAYDESFLYEGSERQELMLQLPMDIVMQVGFFLTCTVNIWLNSQSSSLRELEAAGGIRRDILSVTAG